MPDNETACTLDTPSPDANNQEPKTNNPVPPACTLGDSPSDSNNQEPKTNNPPPAACTQYAPLGLCVPQTTNHQPPTTLPEIASAISEMLRAADHVPLAIGRFLAETYYDNSRHLFSSRKRKRFSLRALTRLLREQCTLSRSFSSLRQMIAAHFQEPELALSADEVDRLSWRARVELLRVHDPAEKSRLARECLAQKWSSREMHYRCRGLCTPVMAPRTKGERLLRSALRLCRELEDWKDAPPDDLVRIREVILLINQDFRSVHAQPAAPAPKKFGYW